MYHQLHCGSLQQCTWCYSLSVCMYIFEQLQPVWTWRMDLGRFCICTWCMECHPIQETTLTCPENKKIQLPSISGPREVRACNWIHQRMFQLIMWPSPTNQQCRWSWACNCLDKGLYHYPHWSSRLNMDKKIPSPSKSLCRPDPMLLLTTLKMNWQLRWCMGHEGRGWERSWKKIFLNTLKTKSSCNYLLLYISLKLF